MTLNFVLTLLDEYFTFFRKKYEGKFPSQVPTATFKGNYGTLKTATNDKAGNFSDKDLGLATDQE